MFELRHLRYVLAGQSNIASALPRAACASNPQRSVVASEIEKTKSVLLTA